MQEQGSATVANRSSSATQKLAARRTHMHRIGSGRDGRTEGCDPAGAMGPARRVGSGREGRKEVSPEGTPLRPRAPGPRWPAR
eukprot:3587050-Pyramimonas_sp.AAC.1